MKRGKLHASHVLIGVAALWLLAVADWGGEGIGSGGPHKARAKSLAGTQRKATRRGASVIDVDSPKVRTATAAERATYAKKRPADAGTLSASPVLEPHRGPRIPSGYNPDQATVRAPAMAAYLAKKGPRAYSHEELAAWQRLAGIADDGNYGGSTRGALVFYGVVDPPRPFSAPFATLPFHPPGMQP